MQPNQKKLFQDIRHFLAGRAIGLTRDDALLDEVMKCLLIRKHMLLHDAAPASSDPKTIHDQYQLLSEQSQGLPGTSRKVHLDADSIAYIDGKLSLIDLISPSADPVGDLYEAFIGSAIRGSEGQFFTPQNAAQWLVDAIAPTAGEMVIDPACGAGGFLVLAAQKSMGSAKIFGIEKDEYLAQLAVARMAVLGVRRANISCANSLSFEVRDGKFLKEEDFIGQFDVVLTNPPFGKNIVSVSQELQQRFSLGHKWKRVPSTGRLKITQDVANKAPPQVLFVERILSLLKKGGRAGIVLPESILSNRSYSHVVQYIRDNSSVQAVVGMPESLFKHSGKGGTHTKTALLIIEKGVPQTRIFMAEAKWCGNDSRGRKIANDDLPGLAEEFRLFSANKSISKAFEVKSEEIGHNILAPRYHEPAGRIATHHLKSTHELVTIGELIEKGILKVSTGDEVGKLAYGTGTIPFIRTSDIAGWEVKIDPKHCVSQDIYDKISRKQDVKTNDVLMVRDGTYLIGSCAIVTKYDEKIVYQSHLLKFRCEQPDKLDPYLLLASLSSIPVQRQIKAKTFTQDIIDSLGTRYTEVILPIPKSATARGEIIEMVKKVIYDRIEAREIARMAKLLVAPPLDDIELAELEITAN